MRINHEAFVNIYNKDKSMLDIIFTDIKKFNQLTYRINKESKRFPLISYDNEDKLKGDLFEIFAECFFKLFSSDNRIGVYNYEPCSSVEDYGVDGFGKGMDNKSLTVQVKYRSDATIELTQDDVKQFALQSIVNYDVCKNTTNNMILFTSGKGLHWLTDQKVFVGRIKTIGYKEISSMVDNNNVFWNNVKDMINETIKFRYGTNEN